MRTQAGFTLIELVAVMLILAILAVVAVPQFVDLRGEARLAATQGVAGALSSGSSLNFAHRSVSSANGHAIVNCQDVEDTLQGGALPTGYSIGSLAVAAGDQEECTLTGPGGAVATFVAIGIL
jgi:MSHA pilin protein MshA